MTVSTEPIAFDPYDYAFQEDPYPTYARLRAEDPLHHNEQHDVWVLTRHADIADAVRNEGVYSNGMGVSIDKGAWGPDAHKVMSILALDPPRQTRLRSLVSRGFTPRRVRELEPQIQRIVDRHLDAALESDSFDWITDFAGRMPMDVISELMGVPEADRDEVRRLADLLVHREDGVHDVPAAGVEAAITLFGYYADMLAQRKQQPTDDLTSALLAARLENGSSDGDRLDDEEIIAFLFLMVVAGNETTTKLLGNALFHLSAHPDQRRARLRRTPAGSSPGSRRRCATTPPARCWPGTCWPTSSCTDRVAPAGSKLLIVLGSANRDERVFDRPDEYDITRDPAELAQLLSFGGGRHFCLGANLARLEARIALEELVRRVRTSTSTATGAVRVHSINVRGFAELPVTVEAR